MSEFLLTLDAALQQAKQPNAVPERLFDCPVLLVVAEAPESGERTVATTANTHPGRGGPASSGAETTWVAPVRQRYPNASSGMVSFGRSSTCDLVLPFSPVSKRHGFFQPEKGRWYVVDVGSTNGTVVDGTRAMTHGLELRDGATILLGKVTLKFLSPQTFGAILRQRLALEPRR